MKLIKSILCTLSLSAIAFVLLVQAAELKQILPSEMTDHQWVLEDDPFIAVDEASLSMVINGAAPQYMELGVKKAAFLNFSNQNIYLMVEIYEAASEESANLLYKEFLQPKSMPLEETGSEGRITSQMGGSSMVEFWENRYYIRLSVTKKTPESRESILQCARIISKKINQNK